MTVPAAAMRIARPLLLVTTPIGVIFGLREAWRLAGPAMAVLMALMLAVVGAFVVWTVRTVRNESAREGPIGSRVANTDDEGR